MAILIVFWLMCGVLSAIIADSKGGNAGIGFLIGALFGPLGIIAAFFMGSDAGQQDKQLSTGAKKKCDRCAELVQPEAKVCRYCGHEFSDAETAAAA